MIDRKTAGRLAEMWNALEVLRLNAVAVGLGFSSGNVDAEQDEIESALLNSGYSFRYESDGARIVLY